MSREWHVDKPADRIEQDPECAPWAGQRRITLAEMIAMVRRGQGGQVRLEMVLRLGPAAVNRVAIGTRVYLNVSENLSMTTVECDGGRLVGAHWRTEMVVNDLIRIVRFDIGGSESYLLPLYEDGDAPMDAQVSASVRLTCWTQSPQG
jgi:hypothetical protein